MNDLVAVSIVSFNGKPFLGECLDCVASQTYQPLSVFLLDNASTDGSVEFVQSKYPKVNVITSRANLGFAAGHNRILQATSSPFALVLNQDAFISPTFIEELISAMKQHPQVGIAGGKLHSCRHREDPDNRKVIDMTWLDIEKKRRQVCYAQGEVDSGQAGTPTFAFALDGAAMLLRRSMLSEIQIAGEYFDEDFFAGKEDLDISWRAQLAGWKCLYVPSATGRHMRTFTPQDKRSHISESLRAASIRNRYLLMLKNDLPSHLIKHLPHILFYELKILTYVLLFERSSLKGYAEAITLLPRALDKRRIIMRSKKAESRYISAWFR